MCGGWDRRITSSSWPAWFTQKIQTSRGHIKRSFFNIEHELNAYGIQFPSLQFWKLDLSKNFDKDPIQGCAGQGSKGGNNIDHTRASNRIKLTESKDRSHLGVGRILEKEWDANPHTPTYSIIHCGWIGRFNMVRLLPFGLAESTIPGCYVTILKIGTSPLREKGWLTGLRNYMRLGQLLKLRRFTTLLLSWLAASCFINLTCILFCLLAWHS